MNPLEPLTWQSLQIYREEAWNEENPFTLAQRSELLIITDQAEERGHKVRNIKKFGQLLQEYDRLYREWGGDMERLNQKIDTVYTEYNKILPVNKLMASCGGIAKAQKGITGKVLRRRF